MPLWLIFSLLAAACVLVGIGFTFAGKQPATSSGGVLVRRNVEQLTSWDEASGFLEELRGQPPSVIQHTVDAILKRWVINQNDKTAASRTRFLKTKLEQLKLVKEGQQLQIDLEVMALERDKRIKTLQIENDRLDGQLASQSELDRLEQTRQRKEKELEIAKLDQQINDFKNRSPKKTAQQERAENRSFWESEVSRLEDAKQRAASAVSAKDEAGRKRTENMYDNAIENARQQLSKFL